MPYETDTIRAFEGVNEDENPFSLRKGELTIGDNLARYGNTVGTRPGTPRPTSGQDYDKALRDGVPARVNTPIQGFAEYRQNFDEGRVLVVLAELSGGTVRLWYGADNEQIQPGSPPVMTAGVGNRWSFAMHNNLLWGAGGAATDDIWTFDGDTGGGGAGPQTRALTDKGTGARLRPKFVKSWRNYLLLNGLRGGTVFSNNPSSTRYLDFGQDPTVDANWADGNTLGFSAVRVGQDSFGESFTTGFGEYRDNDIDALLVLSNNKLTSWVLDPSNDFRQTDVIANGCICEKAFVSLGVDSGDAVYMSPFGTIHSVRQSQQAGVRADAYLSWKIRKTIQTINLVSIARSAAAYDRINGRVFFGVPTGSSTTLDTILMLDIKDLTELTADNARWYIWKMAGFNIVDMGYFRDENNVGHLYLAGDQGDVAWIDDSIFSDVTDADSTVGYTATMQTRHDAQGDPDSKITVGNVTLTMQPGGSQQPTYRRVFDFGNRTGSPRPIRMGLPTAALVGVGLVGVSTIGAAEITQNVKLHAPGAGHTVAHRISHSGENEPWRVAAIASQNRVSREDPGSVAA